MPIDPPQARITRYFRARIADQTIKVGDLLPTRTNVAADFDCSTGTVQNAWRTLRAEGLVALEGRCYRVVRRPSMDRDLPAEVDALRRDLDNLVARLRDLANDT